MQPPDRLPPGPRLPSFVQLMRFGHNAANFLDSLRETHGPTFRVRFPLQPDVIITSDSEIMGMLLSADPNTIPPAPANFAIRSIFGEQSLLFLKGEAHRQERNLLTPHLSLEASLGHIDTVQRQIELSCQDLPDQDMPVYPWAYRLALRLSLILFWGCQRSDLIHRIEQVVESSRDRYESYRNMTLDSLAMNREQHPVASRFAGFLQGNHRDDLRQQFAELIQEQVDDLFQNPDRSVSCPLADRARKSCAHGRVDDATVDFAMTLLIAAYDPPAATLSWLLLELGRCPDLQQRARDGLESSSAADRSFLDACIMEVYRLYPPLHSITRTLTHPFHGKGFFFPEGAYVLPSIYLLHRESKHWTNPLSYQPARFAEQNETPRTLREGYLPFGAGVRTCPGQHFATVLVRNVTAQMLQRFRWTTPSGAPMHPKTLGPTLVPDLKLRIRIERIV